MVTMLMGEKMDMKYAGTMHDQPPLNIRDNCNQTAFKSF